MTSVTIMELQSRPLISHEWLRQAPAQPPVNLGECNAAQNSDTVRDPVIEVCAAPKVGLHKLDEATECACTEEDEAKPYAPRTRQRKCEGRECDEVDDFVTAVGAWGTLEGPQHCGRQDAGAYYSQWNVEILTHAVLLWTN